MQIKDVLVAGPNGSLGQTTIRHLLKNKFAVTLLTRNVTKTKESFPECAVVEADYGSADQLTQTIKSHVDSADALISLLNRDEVDDQIRLMEAAVAAGITHIVPSCFGGFMDIPEVRRLPIWFTKAKMEDWVVEQSKKGNLTYTGIQNGAFLDWGLDRGLYLNTKGGPTMVFDDGDARYSATLVDDVGKAVAGVLLKPDEFKNRFVYIHSAVITQNQLLGYAKELDPNREFETVRLDTAEMEKKGWERYNAGDHSTEVMRMFMPRAQFGLRIGEFKQVENEALGIEKMSDEQVKQFVSKYM